MPLLHFYCLRLTLLLITPFEPLYTPGSIYDSLLTGVIGVALTAQLDSDFLLCRADCKSISTGTDYFSFREILRMNLFFHISYSA